MEETSLFAQRLRMARTQKNMTQKELAEAIGIKAATISAYENADEKKRIAPSLENAVAIAQTLNISLDHLCGLNVSQESSDKPYLFLQSLTMAYDVFSCDDQITLQECYHQGYIDGEYVRHYDGFGIVFSDDFMEDFFKEWTAIWNLKDKQTIDPDTYDSIVAVLCKKYAEKIKQAQLEELPF